MTKEYWQTFNYVRLAKIIIFIVATILYLRFPKPKLQESEFEIGRVDCQFAYITEQAPMSQCLCRYDGVCAWGRYGISFRSAKYEE